MTKGKYENHKANLAGRRKETERTIDGGYDPLINVGIDQVK